jgi:glyoxylase-like metal-dependent hydrolase (beta-lactamase superfamily II)
MRAMKLPALALATALIAATPAVARATGGEPGENLTTQKLGDNLFLIQGPGGNIALLVGKSAMLIVDDQIAPMTPKLREALKAISPKPVRFVINTHWHGDHTGGNPALGADGAVIVAHDNVRKRLSTDQFNAFMNRKIPAMAPEGLPVITFAQSLSFHFDGEDIDVVHLDPAHTDGDSFVYFKKANVLHTGDTFTSAGYPFIDVDSGGTSLGFVQAADKMLAVAQPTTRYIPGHGPVSDRAKLKSWRDMNATVRERVAKLAAQGKTLAEVQAAKPTAEFDAAWGHAFIKPSVLVETIYKEVTKKP